VELITYQLAEPITYQLPELIIYQLAGLITLCPQPLHLAPRPRPQPHPQPQPRNPTLNTRIENPRRDPKPNPQTPCNFHPSGWLRASALTCRLISLVGVTWSYFRIDQQAFLKLSKQEELRQQRERGDAPRCRETHAYTHTHSLSLSHTHTHIHTHTLTHTHTHTHTTGGAEAAAREGRGA